jgi:hypothetical protein
MPVIVADLDAPEIKPDVKLEIVTYMDGIRWEADLAVWRGDGLGSDLLYFICELGEFDLRYPDGLNRRELRDWATKTLRDLIAQLREHSEDDWRVPRSEWEPA